LDTPLYNQLVYKFTVFYNDFSTWN